MGNWCACPSPACVLVSFDHLVSRGEEDRTLGTVEPTCKSLCVGSLELPHVVCRAEDVVT